MLKLVIFDMDGLMFDTEAVTLNAYLDVLEQMGYEPSREQYLTYLGLNRPAIIAGYRKSFGEDAPVEEMYDAVGARKMELLRTKGMPVKPGLSYLLDYIEEKGIDKVIASGSEADVIEENLRNAGMAHRFSHFVSTRQIPRGKPFPDVFLAICEQMGVKPCEALVFEDSENGVRAALAAGIPVINVPDMIPIAEEYQTQCLAVLKTLDLAVPFIEERLQEQ